MPRKVAPLFDKLALDKEVTNLVTRVGALDNPGNFISRYTIERDPGGPTWITVKFIADDEFCKVAVKEESTNG